MPNWEDLIVSVNSRSGSALCGLVNYGQYRPRLVYLVSAYCALWICLFCTFTYRWKPYSQVQHLYLSWYLERTPSVLISTALQSQHPPSPHHVPITPLQTVYSVSLTDPFLSALKGILNINCWRYSLMKSMNSSKNSLWSLFCQFTIKFNHNLGWVWVKVSIFWGHDWLMWNEKKRMIHRCVWKNVCLLFITMVKREQHWLKLHDKYTNIIFEQYQGFYLCCRDFSYVQPHWMIDNLPVIKKGLIV